MGVRTVKITVCDKCKMDVIEGQIWMDYGYCGVAFHWDCVLDMSATQFIELVHENGDQMFINDTVEDGMNNAVELKHLSWRSNPKNMANILDAGRRNRV